MDDGIKFSSVTSRPWNNFDFVSVGAFTLTAAFASVYLMFAAKDD